MGAVLELAEALWTGKTDTYQHHPFSQPHGLENVAENTWFYRGFSNSIFRGTAEGMVIIDPGSFWDSRLRFEAIRAQINSPLDTAIFTHGHTDHVFGMNHYIDEAKENNQPWGNAESSRPLKTPPCCSNPCLNKPSH
jgi:glyoxylase-like metal-dependent hydrolase (beta-lactamase superfamily II)